MLSKTPPMGFNTWNTFGENINEQLIKETADKMVELGLRDCGYEYLVIDDCWSKRERDPQTGKIVPDEEKFPNGMKAVSDYVHSKGLKFGMYSCAGQRTCADYPGSFDHEFLDAETFASWGVDYLKYDWNPNDEYNVRLMADALRATGRDIVYSLSNSSKVGMASYITKYANCWRTTGDIRDNWANMSKIGFGQDKWASFKRPGNWPDADMLVVGKVGWGPSTHDSKLSADEQYTHITLWSILA